MGLWGAPWRSWVGLVGFGSVFGRLWAVLGRPWGAGKGSGKGSGGSLGGPWGGLGGLGWGLWGSWKGSWGGLGGLGAAFGAIPKTFKNHWFFQWFLKVLGYGALPKRASNQQKIDAKIICPSMLSCRSILGPKWIQNGPQMGPKRGPKSSKNGVRNQLQKCIQKKDPWKV